MLQGILPAVVTSLDANRHFYRPGLEQLFQRLYAADVDGVYVCGQTGEGRSLPVDQRMLAAEAAVECSPAGKSVVIHVGSFHNEDAIELARHAARAGASAISSLPPADANSFSDVYKYYQRLAEQSNLPLLVYYFPELCAHITQTDELFQLAAIPNVAGFKFTDFNLFRLALLRASGAIVFNGRDEVLAAGLLMGASGGIGTFYNLVPELFVQVHRLGEAGDWDGARRVQMRINELIALVLKFPIFSAVKRMLAWSGIDCGECLPPWQPLTSDEEDRLRSALRNSSFANAPFAGASLTSPAAR